MAHIGVTIALSGLTGKLIIRWVEASAPLAEVGRSDPYDFPYDDVYSIDDINPVVHYVQLWQSADGSTLTQLIREWDIDAGFTNTIKAITYQYVVDRGLNSVVSPLWADPVNLDTVLTDERLEGVTKEELRVEEVGFGPKLDAEYDLKPGGGIILLDGKTFDANVAWFITRQNLQTIQTPTSNTSANQFKDVVDISADTDFYTDVNNNLYGKFVNANGSGSVDTYGNTAPLTVAFLALSLIPNFTKVTFSTHGGTQRYLILQFTSGDTVNYLGVARNTIYIRRGEIVSLFFKDGKCYLTTDGHYTKRLGFPFFGYKGDLNSLPADSSVHDQADYPGFVEEFLDMLDASLVVDMTTRNSTQLVDYVIIEKSTTPFTEVKEQKTIYPYRGFFGRDDLAGTFQMPDLRDMAIRGYLPGDTTRAVDLPGGYQIDSFKSHEHNINTTGSNNPDPGRAAKRGNVTGDGFFNGTGTRIIGRAGTSKTRGENIGLIPLFGI